MLRVVGKSSGTQYLLGPSAITGRGTEGIVYRFDDVAVKVFLSDPDEDLIAKIDTLIRFAQTVDGFAWPTETVHEIFDVKIVGFAMPIAPGRTLEALLDNRETAQLPTEQKICVATAIARAVASAHDAIGLTICLGDVLKASNVLVSGDAATLVDAASVSLYGFRATNGKLIDSVSQLVTPGYVPHEMLAYPQTKPNHSADCFALAVVLFELFFGRSPTDPRPCAAAVGLESDEAVRRGLFVRYITHPEFVPPTYDPIAVPDEVDEMFRVAFLGPPHQRPTANEWIERLSAWRSAITPIRESQLGWFHDWWPKVVEFSRRFDAILKGVLATTSAIVLIRWVMVMGPSVYDGAKSMLFPVPTEVLPVTPTPTKPVGPPLFREIFQ